MVTDNTAVRWEEMVTVISSIPFDIMHNYGICPLLTILSTICPCQNGLAVDLGLCRESFNHSFGGRSVYPSSPLVALSFKQDRFQPPPEQDCMSAAIHSLQTCMRWNPTWTGWILSSSNRNALVTRSVPPSCIYFTVNLLPL